MDLIDEAMKRGGGSVLTMDLVDFIDFYIPLYERVKEKEFEGRVWEEWTSFMPNATEKSFIPWGEFLDKRKKLLTQPTKKAKSTAKQRLEKAERIKQADQKRR